MQFTDDELRMILDALSSLDNNVKLDEEEAALMQSIRVKIKGHFNTTPSV